MFRVRRRLATRLSAALAATGLLAAGAIATAAPAAADDPNPGGAAAVLGGLTTAGPAVIHTPRGDKQISAGLFKLSVNGGGELQTYCIDIHNPTQKDAKYQETAWNQSSLHANDNAGKILWILQNSFPQVNDLAKLAADAGAGSLTDKQAATGTQVAIWRLSDGVDVEAKDEAAEKLADFLGDKAQSLQEPEASLKLDPAAVSGKAGEKLGPIKVSTSASSAALTVDAEAAAKKVTVVNKEGKPVTSAADGDELFFEVPKDAAEGAASLSVKATTTVPVGRVFTGVGANKGSQTQILAGSSASTVEATATANWAPGDHEGPLPAVTAEKNCVEGGLDISVDNTQGTEEFVFSLKGKEHKIAAGKKEDVFLAVEEDSAYKVEIAMPNGGKEVFEGILDCKTEGTTGGGEPSSEPTPASAGGSSEGSTGGGDLADTGSSSATPVIAGVAVGLVVVGGAAVFLLRKRRTAASGE